MESIYQRLTSKIHRSWGWRLWDRLTRYRAPHVLVLSDEEVHELHKLLSLMRPSYEAPVTVIEGQGCLIDVLRGGTGTFFAPESVDAIVTKDGQLGIQFSSFGMTEGEKWPILTVSAYPLLSAMLHGPGSAYIYDAVHEVPLWMTRAEKQAAR